MPSGDRWAAWEGNGPVYPHLIASISLIFPRYQLEIVSYQSGSLQSKADFSPCATILTVSGQDSLTVSGKSLMGMIRSVVRGRWRSVECALFQMRQGAERAR
jgi:hypothetical protein